MDYFRVLNLRREPFSNSPDPEFFFQSRQHISCLQKLELSIRLRRGLSVIIGEVGTGKTTLCRQLIRKFADDEKVETHLLLDPHFTSLMEFLNAVAVMFGLTSSNDQAEDSSWRLKEYIKNYLFQRGVDEQRTVVLLIDEGQKLPDFCIESLREFLNYETNEYKLLQTVIFAQEEFREIIAARPNFADRINYGQTLGPLSFLETRKMVQFRLNQAREGYRAPQLFSTLGLLAIHRVSGGYPRKIIHLCHRALIALIVRNQTKAGWNLIHWCGKMLNPVPSKRRRRGVL